MSSRFTEILFIAVEVSRLLGSLIGGAPWRGGSFDRRCAVVVVGIERLVAELLEIILVKGVVYCTTLGSCVLRVAGCWLPGAVGRSKVQHDGT